MSSERVQVLGEVHGHWTAIVRPIGHDDCPIAFYVVKPSRRNRLDSTVILRSSAGLRIECSSEKVARALVYKVAAWEGLTTVKPTTSWHNASKYRGL